jgi:pimeloyl-ACP methyl ester carboxylesterase
MIIMETLKSSDYAPVNGLSMYYEIHGSDTTPMVLIHGGGSTIETTFGSMIPLLSATNQLIAVELQAHGRTSDRDAPESFAQDADDVAGLLNYLKVEKANIFGFSNGASTAMQVAIRHPEIVNKVIVVAGAYKRDGFIPGFFDGFKNATLDNMPQILQDAYLKVTPDSAGLRNMFNKDVARMATFKDWPDDDLRSIKAGTLFLASTMDVILVEHAIQMANLVPGAQLAVIPGPHGSLIGTMESGIKKDSKLPGITAALIEEFLNG